MTGGTATPGALESAIAALSPLDLLVAATWVLILAFVCIEVLLVGQQGAPQRRAVRRRSAVAVRMAAGAVVVGVPYGAVFAFAWGHLSRLAPDQLAPFWQRHPVLAAAFAFVAWDLSGFAYHVVGHHSRLGWAAHSAHHSDAHFEASLALRLTWMPWHGLLHHPLLALSGLPLELVLGCLAVSNAMQALQHSCLLGRPPRWLAAVIMTPGAHRHHHRLEGKAVNLGPVLTIWDRVFGTWLPPDGAPAGPRPGADALLADPIARRGAFAAELHGWRQLVCGGTTPRASGYVGSVGSGSRARPTL